MNRKTQGLPDDARLRWTFEWQSSNLWPLLQSHGPDRAVHAYWRELRHLDEVRSVTGVDDADVVLDVGCGLATVLRVVGTRARIGVDPLARAYASLGTSEQPTYPHGVTVRCAEGESLPIEDSSVDVAFCNNMIDHTMEPHRVMSELRRVVRSGGFLVLSCELRDPSEPRNAGHPHAFNERDLEALLEDWQVVRCWKTPWDGIASYLGGAPGEGLHEWLAVARK